MHAHGSLASARRIAVFASVLALSLAGTIAIASLTAPGAQASVPRPRIVLYGDSLAWEARNYFVWSATYGGGIARARTYGGTATCDWIRTIRSELAAEPVSVVVLAFSGNALTPCMQDPETGLPLTGDEFLEAYDRATRRVIRIAREHGARVVLVGGPAPRDPRPGWDALFQLYAAIAERPRVDYVNGASRITPQGRWRRRAPCLADETEAMGCVDGRIRVRSSDGHFCPADPQTLQGVVGACPVYSSGARRYAEAMARAALRAAR